MFILSTYLIGALISAYLFSPKSNFGLWRGVLTIPVLLTCLYILYFLNESNNGYGYSMFKFGATFPKCIIPLIISCVVIYFLLKKKMKNEGKVRFPIILVVCSIVTLGVSIYEENLEFELRNNSSNEKALSKEQEVALNWIMINVATLKENIPIKITEDLYLVNVAYDLNENKIFYTYKNSGSELSEKNYWRDLFLSVLRNDKNKEAYIEVNTSIHYNITDKAGKTIEEFILNPNEFK